MIHVLFIALIDSRFVVADHYITDFKKGQMGGNVNALRNIFVHLAGLAVIGGGYLVWLWLRESKPLWYGAAGGVILILYGVIPALQSFPAFGRVYAAYGSVFIVLA